MMIPEIEADLVAIVRDEALLEEQRFIPRFAGHSNAFSFNDPQGMCPECNGTGRKIGVDLDKFLDKSKSLNDGAILYPEYAVENWG